ncbi:MAG: flagellar basal-body rod protein FlgG [Proteobacteria bacterium]|nr:flagellar basal-body rod protein FlgG [Pseudomonadota bacterium]MBU1140230.1 flagellar basal-body rod protein FlgG [Pseudomonadota bacterium]MBU1231588.1 flagellar basal-body rod protein FlgG [Pseudomonadota bacterium]MBU1416935.1 flagellar basal-body rod protein FlgG [Pseudomonadota bacterium]MBU1456692.1 flagellar basal-body rod protein FlgG [Pseudomonadota bacterium]
MIRSLWTGTTGMNGQQLNLDVIANNLANVSTTGFKKSRADFQDLMYQIMKVPGSQTSADTESPSGIQVGLGVRPAAVQKLFTQGDLIQTGNELDVAIEGAGFFQVELPTGVTAYTRAGALKRDGDGRVTNSDGYPITPGITIPDGSRQITISETGIISAIIGDDTESTEIGTFETVTFTNNGGLVAVGKNLFRESNSSGTAQAGTPGGDGYGLLLQSFLEGSNVNIVEELTAMITTQRAYEINSKTIQTSDEMMQTTNNLV